MRRSYSPSIILIGIICLFSFMTAEAQAPGYAEIVSPSAGEAVTGLMTIEGSASHPLFVAYDLAFTYQDTDIETWFFIVETRSVQVVDERLGLWDTNGISDGEYKLRLRILLQNGTTLEDVIEGIRIRNETTIETATPAAVKGSLPTSTPVPATPTTHPTSVALPGSPGGSSVVLALETGLTIGSIGMIVLGIYLYIRRRIRIRWGILRMRRMLWQDERKKRRDN